MRRNLTIPQLPGKKVLMVEKTVSQYLFERAMTIGGLESQIGHVKLVNTSDSDIATAFISDTNQDAVVTWKPMVSQIAKAKGVTNLRLLEDSGRNRRSDGGPDRHPEPAGWLRAAFRQSARRSAWFDHEADDRNWPQTDKVLQGIAQGSGIRSRLTKRC